MTSPSTPARGGYDAEAVPDLLGPQGPLATVLRLYEDRPFQREMALEVARLFEEGGFLAVEAPTGIGKSLAYGLPAALWALEGDGPVVLSTYTKALQEQLLGTEVPRIRSLVGRELQAEVLKGRNNYLCRRRYEAVCREVEGNEKAARTRDLLRELRPWVESTPTGDLAECGVRGTRDLQFLHLRISSDPVYCSSRDCVPAGGCFFKIARNRAQSADLLIVNHALLAIHLFDGQQVLPEFDALVIDEAHAFVTAALDHLSCQVGPGRLAATLARVPDDLHPPLLREGEGQSRLSAFLKAMRAAEGAMREGCGKGNGIRPPGDARQRFRDPEALLRLCPQSFDTLDNALGLLDADTEALLRFMEREVTEEDAPGQVFLAQLGRFREEAALLRRDLDDVIHPDPNDPDWVHWKEWVGEDAFTLNRAPLEVGSRLVPSLDQGPKRVIFTSATLAAGQDFTYFARELGLEGRLHAHAFPSPFEYERQVLALAVRQAPDPRHESWAEATAATLDGLLRDPGRKTMALFTSYRDLQAVARALGPRAESGAYSVLAQGPGESPARLLEAFRRHERGLLLGTSSFWQGIDLPGTDLEVLVLTRLPFGVPTDPRLEARSERLERDGGSPFMDLYLPEAVLRFKQGFGRLIRRGTDRGVLVVLDPRLSTKGYGRKFRGALPVAVEVVTDGAEAVARAGAWWRAPARGGTE